jgi:hypothetical protein
MPVRSGGTRVLLFFLLLSVATPFWLKSQTVDHSAFDMLCGMHVKRDGTVQYEGFRSPAFSRYVLSFASLDTAAMSAEERLATLVNVYNACVIQNVLDHAPLSSVMDISSFFDRQKFRVAGRLYSLREIEREFLLPLAPALSHFALTLAARSAPVLPRRAYRSEGIRGQLQRAAERFMQDRARNRLDRSAGVLYLSMIFQWHREDFERVFGSLRQCAMHFLGEEDSRWLADNEIDIQFLPWDWSLNERQP